jgi:hypothetical protein
MTVDPGIDFTLSDAIWRLCMWFHARLLCNKAKNKEKVADGQMLTLRDLFYGENDPPQLKHKPSRERYKE